MARITSQLNGRGIRQLVTSPEVQARVDEVGQALAARAGDGFEYTRGHGASPRSARGFVQPTSARAMRRQARDAVLERSLGSSVS